MDEIGASFLARIAVTVTASATPAIGSVTFTVRFEYFSRRGMSLAYVFFAFS